MIKIVVGSTNPVKVKAAQAGISKVLSAQTIKVEGCKAPSGVSEQPMNEQDTRQGAINRVKFCQRHGQADYFVAIEGGVDHFEDGPATFAYVAIANGKTMSVNRSTSMPIPVHVYHALQQGEELGSVMDRLFNMQNVKQKQGAIGLLTNEQASRESVYTQAIILAMARFIHPDFYTTI